MSPPVEQGATVAPLAAVRSFWQPILRRKWLFAVVFLAVLGCVAVVTLLTPPEYRSQAKLFLRLGRENAAVEPLTAVGHETLLALPPTREEEVNSVTELIASQQVVGKVVDELGTQFVLGNEESLMSNATEVAQTTLKLRLTRADVPTDQQPLSTALGAANGAEVPSMGSDSVVRDKAVRHVLSHLTVSAERKSLIITVEYDGRSPETAKTILQAILQTYIELHTNMYRVEGAYEFLKEHADEHRRRLLAAEDELSELRNQTGLASLVEQRSLLLQQLSHTQDELMRAEVELNSRREAVAALEHALAATPTTRVAETTTGVANQGFDLMRQRLFELEVQEQKFRSIYTEEHFELENIRREIAELRGLLKEQPFDRIEQKTALNKNHEDLQLSLLIEKKELAVVQSREAALRGQTKQLEQQVASMNKNALKIERLEREVALLETSYRQYAENVEQARMDETIRQHQLSNISIAQTPTWPARPVWPNLLLNGLLGLFAASAAATGSAWMWDRRGTAARLAGTAM